MVNLSMIADIGLHQIVKIKYINYGRRVTPNHKNKILIFFLIMDICVTPITTTGVTMVKKRKNPHPIGSREGKEESSQHVEVSKY